MKRPANIAAAGFGVVTIVIGYLLLWPVPVDPVAWTAPQDQGLVDPFAANDRLQFAQPIDLGDKHGPEDVSGRGDGFIYASTLDGSIVRFRSNGSELETFADVGGRPLGIEFDADGNLLVANSYLGLQRVSADGKVETLVSQHGGQDIGYANDVAVAQDGTIYFSDSSSKFPAQDYGGAYAASRLDILEHGGHGRVFRLDAETRQTTVIMDGLNFANGVAISDDQQFLLIAETGHYRVWRHWLGGERAGQSEVVLDNLPGFPDNINNGLQGRFWIGLVAPRVKMLDDMSEKPGMRKMAQRLPDFARPQALPSTHVIAVTGEGQVLMNLQDSAARLPAITGVYETKRSLYLSALFGSYLARLDKRDLQFQ